MNKPNTVHNAATAALVDWLRCYPTMRQNPRAWFANQRFTLDELAMASRAGFPDVAAALGYRPVSGYMPLPEIEITVIPQPTTAAIAA